MFFIEVSTLLEDWFLTTLYCWYLAFSFVVVCMFVYWLFWLVCRFFRWLRSRRKKNAD